METKPADSRQLTPRKLKVYDRPARKKVVPFGTRFGYNPFYTVVPPIRFAILMADSYGPISVQPRSAVSRVSTFFSLSGIESSRFASRFLRSASCAAAIVLLFSSAAFGATPRHKQSQDVAEAARQERARKQEQQKTKKHVYTNEDLSRAKILTPEDEARVEAKKNECVKNNNCAPAEKTQDALDANSQKPGTSLGEVARQYRKRKENQKELDALKPKQSEPFHLPSSEPVLASPILPAHPTLRQPAAPAIRPGTGSHVMRRDPFARVPVQPARPEAKAPAQPEVQPNVLPDVRDEIAGVAKPNLAPGFFADVRPAYDRSAHRKLPRAPRVFAWRTPLSVWVEPSRPAAPVEIEPALSEQPLTVAPAAIESAIPTQPLTARPRNFAVLKPIVPAGKVREVQPKAPALASPIAPADSIRPAQPEVLALSTPAAPATTIQPVQPTQRTPTTSSVLRTGVLENKTVTVKRGDSLWKVAQQILGSGSRWPELASSNPWIANPNQIQPGARLALPAVSATPISSSAGTHPTQRIKVRRGDTLWSLAKVNLGRWSAWACLAAANPTISDPNRIQEGQELSIPSSCSDVSRGALLPDEK